VHGLLIFSDDTYIVALGASGLWISRDSGATFTVNTQVSYLTSPQFTSPDFAMVNGMVTIASPRTTVVRNSEPI
jgi:hypothetical protein